jgi:hypothetical protein
MHSLVSAAAELNAAAAPHLTNLAATSDNGTPTTAPPGIFLRLYIFCGFSFVVLCAWFVLRGYLKSSDGPKDAKQQPKTRAEVNQKAATRAD